MIKFKAFRVPNAKKLKKQNEEQLLFLSKAQMQISSFLEAKIKPFDEIS
jgi:hypothetical protein